MNQYKFNSKDEEVIFLDVVNEVYDLNTFGTPGDSIYAKMIDSLTKQFPHIDEEYIGEIVQRHIEIATEAQA